LVDDLEQCVHAYDFFVSELVEFETELFQEPCMLLPFWLAVHFFADDALPESPSTLNEHNGEFLPGNPLLGYLSVNGPASFESEGQQERREGKEPTEAIYQYEEVVVVGIDEERRLETRDLEE
jgi:hypothetical protein